MREIKGEINDLMKKIENASRQIYDSYITKKHEVVLSAQKEMQRTERERDKSQEERERARS